MFTKPSSYGPHLAPAHVDRCSPTGHSGPVAACSVPIYMQQCIPRCTCINGFVCGYVPAAKAMFRHMCHLSFQPPSHASLPAWAESCPGQRKVKLIMPHAQYTYSSMYPVMDKHWGPWLCLPSPPAMAHTLHLPMLTGVAPRVTLDLWLHARCQFTCSNVFPGAHASMGLSVAMSQQPKPCLGICVTCRSNRPLTPPSRHGRRAARVSVRSN